MQIRKANNMTIYEFEDGEISIWIEPNGAIIIDCKTETGDPVELSSDNARDIGTLLIRLASD